MVIDPGHGGYQPGAVGTRGTREKDVNLRVSLLLAERLRAAGVEVVLTRKSDVFISLDRRAEIANESGCDLFVSIHSNAVAGNRSMQGYSVVIPADEWKDVERGNAVERARAAVNDGGVVMKNVEMKCPSRSTRAAIYGALIEEFRRRSSRAATDVRAALGRRVRTTDRGNSNDPRGLRVLKRSYCPAVLVELDFLSSPAGEARLSSEKFRRLIAQGLSEGIQTYLEDSAGADE